MAQTCYLLHFDPPYKHARHYIGWTTDLEARIERHFEGHGSRLVRAVVAAGHAVVVARTWPGKDRNYERKLHNRHGTRLCPICMNGGAHARSIQSEDPVGERRDADAARRG